MTVSVPFGNGSISAEIPDGVRVNVVNPTVEAVKGTEAERIEAALDAPVGTPRLEEMVKATDRVLIVVNDHTRPGPNREITAAVLERLHRAGVPDGNIRFICATGSHRAPTDAEMRAIVGDEVVDTYEIVMHDCRDRDSLFRLGEIDGLEVWLNKAVREADFLITTGLIAPHHTAGFSGGRKSI
ncbi:MAG: nickel-dependent lactate racemase, partial [Oscillospiraceae bacterium]|nr:nickel-dependent lactate racemase [Oscillospiraceae bacterium]